MDGDCEWIKRFYFTMDVEQQANDVGLDADRQRLDYKNFMDDEEVTLLHHKRDLNVPTIRVQMSVMDLIRQIHNEKTGYFRQSLFMGLVPGGRQGSDLC